MQEGGTTEEVDGKVKATGTEYSDLLREWKLNDLDYVTQAERRQNAERKWQVVYGYKFVTSEEQVKSERRTSDRK